MYDELPVSRPMVAGAIFRGVEVAPAKASEGWRSPGRWRAVSRALEKGKVAFRGRKEFGNGSRFDPLRLRQPRSV